MSGVARFRAIFCGVAPAFAPVEGRVALLRIANRRAAAQRPAPDSLDPRVHDISIWILIAAVFLLAGTVKGVIGGGLPTIGIGLMGLVIPPAQAAALIVLPSLVTNVWQSFGANFLPLLKRLWLMQVSIVVGSLFAYGVMTGSDADMVRAGLGLALIAYAVSGLLKIRLHLGPRAEFWLASPVGLATGAIGAATGVFVVPSALYLQGIGLDKDDLVQALGITYTVSTVALAAALYEGGAMHVSVAGPSVLALAVSLLGMKIGQSIRARVQEKTFLLLFFIGLLLIGLHLVLRTVL